MRDGNAITVPRPFAHAGSGVTVRCRGRQFDVLVTLLPLALACSCTTTIGPTITTGPGPGKSVGTWEVDKRECMVETDGELQPVANSMNAAAATISQTRAVNARLQAMYDRSYGHCLSARNDLVPAPAIPLQGVPEPPTPEVAIAGGQRAIDASTTPGLSDRVSKDAERFVSSETRALREACPGGTVRLDVHEAPISPGVVARLVGLTEPHGGDCLGTLGELDYLVSKRASGWVTLLSGYLGVRETVHAGYRDVELRSRGACVFEYGWTGASYANIGSNGCDDVSPPGNPRPSRQGPR